MNDLGNMYSMLKSTIMTILQRKILYKEASVAKGIIQINKLQSGVRWGWKALIRINKRELTGYRLSATMIGEKARAINAVLIKDNPPTRDNGATLPAGKGLLELWVSQF